MKLKNVSNGWRGIHDATGAYVEFAPGAEHEVDLTKGEANDLPDYFGGKPDAPEPGPLDASVEDLTAHLATMTDADEVQKLLDAETAGKSRKGAITALEARRDELLA